MGAVRFRPYTPNHLDDVVGIFRSNIPKYFGPREEQGLRDFLAEYGEDYYVLLHDGEIVGSGGIALNPEQTVSLCCGMIRKDHFGTGLGRELTEFQVQGARKVWRPTACHRYFTAYRGVLQ